MFKSLIKHTGEAAGLSVSDRLAGDRRENTARPSVNSRQRLKRPIGLN